MSEDTPIPAATVILLRDEPAFEALMIARAERASFAGGALVFPGGRVDPGDRHAAWAAQSEGLSPDPALAAAQVAAIREAFEEAGVFLARGPSGAMLAADEVRALSPWRANVERDDALFLTLARRHGLKLAADQLTLFAHWIAPPGLHRRFDTLFFVAPFPRGQEVMEDGDEATEALWISPAAAIAARQAGARKIIFPTARNLELLGVSQSTQGVIDFARRRTIRPVVPDTVTRDGRMYLKLPDDLGYPVTEEAFETAIRN
ncbi:MAG TPA: NUDIX hydrolase [Parvularcula sp.]|nr:NUDIX hydrolase [Parvularcula sp.]HBS33317.1 NUDIX hydrolase [Parvularcula sp.]HBS35230.1 NUDIX hydrolase [Parvularcula sp.]